MSAVLRLAASSLIMGLLLPITAHAQATGQSGSNVRALPAPVRPVQHLEPSHGPQWAASSPLAGEVPNPAWRETQPLLPHQVIQAPTRQSSSPQHSRAHRSDPKPHPHPHLQLRRSVQPSPAVLPGGQQRETWKTPYSYGYFGASGTRHWSLHHGYRDRYTEWRLH